MAGEVKQGNWVDGAAVDGERWVDPLDAAAVDAWGTTPVPAPAAAFDPTKAFQEKPQRRTSLQGACISKGSRKLSCLAPCHMNITVHPSANREGHKVSQASVPHLFPM